MHSILGDTIEIPELLDCAIFSNVGLAQAADAILVSLVRVGLIIGVVMLLRQSFLLNHQRLIRLGLLNQVFLEPFDFIF